MIYGILLTLATLILLVIVIRRQPYAISSLTRLGKWLFYIALALIVLYAGLNLTFGIGEMVGGDPSGIIHLLPVLVLALIIWLAWRRPYETGLGLIVIGLMAVSYFVATLRGDWNNILIPIIFGGLPFLLSGLLLLLAVRRNIHEK